MALPDFSKQADYSRRDAQTSPSRFGEVGPDTLQAVFDSALQGYFEDHSDLCYRAISTDGQLLSVLQTRLSGVVGNRIVIEPANGDDPMAAKAAEDIEKILLPTFKNPEQTFGESLFAEYLGFACHEIDWTFDAAGLIFKPQEIAWVHQRRFRVNTFNGELRLYDKGGNSGTLGVGEQLIPNKWVVHKGTGKPGSYGLTGVAEPALWAWMFKRWSAKFWLTLSERLGSPVVYGKVLREAPAEARAAMVSALENLQAGTSMVIEEGGQLEVLNAALSESNSLSGLVDYWDRQIEKTLLGMSGISDQGSVGSYAAVKDRRGATVEMRKILDERALSSTWTEQLVKPFLEFNKRRYGGVVPPIPKLRWQLTNDTADLTAQPALLTAGVLTINEVRASLDLEPVNGPTGDKLLTAQAVQGVVPDAAPPKPAASPAAPTVAPVAAAEAPVEKVADAALNGAQVASLLEIVQLYNAGTVTGEQARATASAAFPSLSPEMLGRLIPEVKPESVPVPQPGGADAVSPLASAQPTPMSRDQSSRSGATLSRFQKRLEELQSKRLADQASSKPKP